MDISEIKVGDFIAVYSNVWKGKRPYPFALVVTYVGTSVVRAKIPGGGRERRLRCDQILRVFENQEQGDICMAAALNTWREQTVLVNNAEDQREKLVLETINAECA